jgi:hypothetical protein
MCPERPEYLSREIVDFLCANLDTLTVRDLAKVHAVVRVVIPKNVPDLMAYVEAIGDSAGN